jgi:hypothetical protein
LRPGDIVETTVVDGAEYDLYAVAQQSKKTKRRVPLRQAAPVKPR